MSSFMSRGTEFKNMFKFVLVCGTRTLINMNNLIYTAFFCVHTPKTPRVAIFHWTFRLSSGVRL